MIEEAVLDNPEVLAAADPGGVLPAVAGGARQVRASWRSAAEAGVADVLADLRPRTIAVVGVGASAVAADILHAVAGPSATVPVVPIAGERLPGWVGPLDVVCVVSGSGSTPATLAVASEAARRGSVVIAVTPVDSPLAGITRTARPGVVVPLDSSGGPSSTQVWALSVPLLAVGAATRMFSLTDDTVEAAAGCLESVAERCGALSSLYVNPAKTLAWEISRYLPVVWGSGDIGAVAARRFGVQLTQIAKLPVTGVALADAAFNDVAALDGAYGALAGMAASGGDFFRDREDDIESVRMRLVLVRDADEPPLAAASLRAVEAVAQGRNIAVSTVRASEGTPGDAGSSPLERLAYLIGVLDFASVYVALGAGLDPAATFAVSEMRERTAQ